MGGWMGEENVVVVWVFHSISKTCIFFYVYIFNMLPRVYCSRKALKVLTVAYFHHFFSSLLAAAKSLLRGCRLYACFSSLTCVLAGYTRVACCLLSYWRHLTVICLR